MRGSFGSKGVLYFIKQNAYCAVYKTFCEIMEDFMIEKKIVTTNIMSMLLVVVLAVSLVTVCPSGTSSAIGEETTAQESVENHGITYNFANFTAGSAYGSITLSTDEAATYNLYWGDKDGNKLTYNGVEFTEFGKINTKLNSTTGSYEGNYKIASPYTAIPEGAEKLLVYKSETKTEYSYNIPESKQFNMGKLSYKFALMSDVHYNRYSDYSADDSVEAFDNALKFVNNQGIDFVGLTGDLSNQGEDSSYKKFNTAINKYPGMTVYTCMGNHDVSWTGNAEKHVKSFAKQVNTKRTKDKNVKVISSNGVDFIYEKQGDIFIFFSQTKAYYRKNAYLVSDDQLNWLEKNLNTYANKNVYLFFHTYMASENGNGATAVGNLMNPAGYSYDLTYIFGNSDEIRFRKILNRYPNVTMFSGHSHWAYDQQKYNSNLNIGNINSKRTGASLVHLASVSAPRTILPNAMQRDENNGVKSEGTIALKYNGCTVYMGVNFKSGKYMAYATYINKDGKKGTPQPAIKTGSTKITSVGKVKKVSKKSKKYKVAIKYRKVAKAYKYQIQYSTNSKFKAGKTKTKYTSKASYTISKLKRKTKYYVRVRAYRYQFGYRIYGSWSKVKKVKTKK